jgi:hypothetical protein
MQYQVEEISPVKKRIEIKVGPEEVNAALMTSVALYRRGRRGQGLPQGQGPLLGHRIALQEGDLFRGDDGPGQHPYQHDLRGAQAHPGDRNRGRRRPTGQGSGVHLLDLLRGPPGNRPSGVQGSEGQEGERPRSAIPRSRRSSTGCATTWRPSSPSFPRSAHRKTARSP